MSARNRAACATTRSSPAPSIIAFFVINGLRYAKLKQPLDLLYLGTWIWLGITIAAYFLYLISGNTAALWAKDMWFSENDVRAMGRAVRVTTARPRRC